MIRNLSINFFKAAVVDESDIWLWWKVGNLAMDVVNLRLARFAFEKVYKNLNK